MTLGIAALFPWLGLVESWPESVRLIINSSPKFRPPPAIVMVADSRWTYSTGRDFDDGAVKLVAVSNRALAIYAGDTIIGPRSLGRLTEELQSAGPERPSKMVRLARGCFQAAWRRFCVTDSKLQVCLGTYDPSSGLHLWRFEDSDGFRPREATGIETIGSTKGRAHFWEEVRERIEDRVGTPLTEAAFSNHIEQWGSALPLAAWNTCTSQVDSTVGGPILIAYLTPGGIQGRSLHTLDPLAAQQTTDQLTLSRDQAEAFSLRQRRQL